MHVFAPQIFFRALHFSPTAARPIFDPLYFQHIGAEIRDPGARNPAARGADYSALPPRARAVIVFSACREVAGTDKTIGGLRRSLSVLFYGNSEPSAGSHKNSLLTGSGVTAPMPDAWSEASSRRR